MTASDLEPGSTIQLDSRGKASDHYVYSALTKDEAVLARYGKRQQLRVSSEPYLRLSQN